MGDPEEAAVDVGQVATTIGVGLAGRQQVVEHRTCTERPSGTGEDDSADILVGLHVVECRQQRGVHLLGDDIASIRVIEGEDGYPATLVGLKHAHGQHCGTGLRFPARRGASVGSLRWTRSPWGGSPPFVCATTGSSGSAA